MRNKTSNEKMMVFAAPSGSGKTTIVRHLLETYEELAFSVSATTREKRFYEKEGRDYYFLTAEEFRKKVDEGNFVEWVEVYEDRFYGTLHNEIKRMWKEGKYILFDIDVKGAMDIKEQFGDKCLAVFVKPPSIDSLIDRLKKRKTETEESLQTRKDRFREELQYEQYFDTVLINDVLAEALEKAEQITENFLNIKKPNKEM